MRAFKNFLLLLPATAMLSGCNTLVLNAPGDVAAQQGRLIIVATLLMLLIIVPVIVLTLWFGWRYRASNQTANYQPDWDHSTALELVIWAAPLMIIIALGAVAWISTHTLDPYRPLRRIDADRAVAPGTPPLVIEAVALDWKWLFIYPELGIATVNEVAAPVDTPILFKITGTTVMNSFFIPALAGQIYAMPSMETRLNAVMNAQGDYVGFSANYSGAGFSDMRFKFRALASDAFEQWVAHARSGNPTLDREAFAALDKPSVREPVHRYARVAPDLFRRILNRCVDDSRMCQDRMMAIDTGGAGSAAAYQVAQLDRRRYVEALACTAANPNGLPPPRPESTPR
ncbi:MAG: ubiquinol oxidase subunit II [Pseudomonadota bacterium]|nr:ubiquinol oxidase subunit II [Pseudomonadota bacterium]